MVMESQGLRGAKGPIITVAIFVVLIVIVAFNFWYQPRHANADVIVKNLALLQSIFKKIDARCKIISFDHQKNPINFLNVGSFKSSEVGPMNLAYPTQWQGPYLDQNLKLQNKEYEIVGTKKGYFIAPGEGVTLPNGKVMGKTVILNENSDIEAMTKDENALMYQGKALALPLPLSSTEWQKILLGQMPDDPLI